MNAIHTSPARERRGRLRKMVPVVISSEVLRSVYRNYRKAGQDAYTARRSVMAFLYECMTGKYG